MQRAPEENPKSWLLAGALLVVTLGLSVGLRVVDFRPAPMPPGSDLVRIVFPTDDSPDIQIFD